MQARNRRRLSTAVVLGVAVIAACLTRVNVSTTSQAIVTVTPQTYDFGTHPNGMQVTSPDITVTPMQISDDDKIMAINLNCPEFGLILTQPLPAQVSNMCDMGSVEPMFGGSTYGACNYVFQTTFTPNSTFEASCNVNIVYAPSMGGPMQTAILTLKGTGMAPAHSMVVTPTTEIEFGDRQINVDSNSQPVQVHNNGTQPLTVTVFNDNPTFVVTPAPPMTTVPLGPNGMLNYSVVCHPTATGFQMGTLSFSTDEGPSGSVTFTCNGIDSEINIAPSPAAFASTMVGRAPPPKKLTISTGGSAQTIDSVAFDPGMPNSELAITQNPEGMQVGSGSPQDIMITYAGATRHPFGKLGTLVVTVGGEPFNIPVNGEALDAGIGSTPSTVDFGPVCVGEKVMQDVKIYASGEAAVQLTAVRPPTSPFTSTNASGVLPANHAGELTVTTSLTATAAGPLEDSIMLDSNVPADAMHPVPLKALAIPAGVSPTPSVVHFGLAMKTVPVLREVVISNCKGSSINVTDATIVGASATEFTIVEPTMPQRSIADRDSMMFRIVMTGRTNGTKAAQLVVTYDDGSTVVADLDGNVFDMDDDDDGIATYYSCAVGGSGPGGTGGIAWPVGLALLVLLRRRRRNT